MDLHVKYLGLELICHISNPKTLILGSIWIIFLYSFTMFLFVITTIILPFEDLFF